MGTLTPEQMGHYIPRVETGWRHEVIETWNAYADIVRRVAETGLETNEYGHSYCMFCAMGEAVVGYTVMSEPVRSLEHRSDCLYLAARKLRGME